MGALMSTNAAPSDAPAQSPAAAGVQDDIVFHDAVSKETRGRTAEGEQDEHQEAPATKSARAGAAKEKAKKGR